MGLATLLLVVVGAFAIILGPVAGTLGSGEPLVVMAAGDIACDPADPNFHGGFGTDSQCRQGLTASLVDPHAAAILLLGDDQYECGGLAAYKASFQPAWGRFRPLIRPAPGNHEYETYPNGTDCSAGGAARGYFDFFGAAAHQDTAGHYSFDLGAWHIIALDSQCPAVGGCRRGSPEETWLRADLAATKEPCILAYWHHPRWSSGRHGDEGQTAAFWDDLYAYHADIVLNGHDHDYERFAPQSPGGVPDPNGIREFVVGTGGRSHDGPGTLAANSEIRNFDTFGVLKLTLRGNGEDWSFIPEPGATFSDSGSGSCHS